MIKLWNVGVFVRIASVLPKFSTGNEGRGGVRFPWNSLFRRNIRFVEYVEYVQRANLRDVGVKSYNPLTFVKKCVAYGLIGYGLVTCWLPSGSQLALIGGCALLGIPFSKVLGKVKDVWFSLVTVYNKVRLYGLGGLL